MEQHDILPLPASGDYSNNEYEAKQLKNQRWLHFLYWIADLLSMTRTDILYAVNKLPKIHQTTWKKHLKQWSIHYRRGNKIYRIWYYSNWRNANLQHAIAAEHTRKHIYFGFMVSLRNDQQDTGRSTCVLLQSTRPCSSVFDGSHIYWRLYDEPFEDACELENMEDKDMEASSILIEKCNWNGSEF